MRTNIIIDYSLIIIDTPHANILDYELIYNNFV